MCALMRNTLLLLLWRNFFSSNSDSIGVEIIPNSTYRQNGANLLEVDLICKELYSADLSCNQVVYR